MVELFLHLQDHDCSKVYLESLLQRIIEAAIVNFDLPRYATYIKTRSSPACISADPIKAFYECVSAREQGTPSRLVGKIQTQLFGLSIEHLKEFLMPFLEELISVVDVSSIEVQECILSLVMTYITRTVGKEPRKPSDWARPEEIDVLEALSCKNVWHLEDQCHSFKYFEVDKVGMQPVAVTKTVKWWEEQYRNWDSRASNALEALQKLPQDKLKYCLTHRYDEVMDLRMVKVIDHSVESTTQRQHPYETRSAVPLKRTRDDL